jgi:hypothetical protein
MNLCLDHDRLPERPGGRLDFGRRSTDDSHIDRDSVARENLRGLVFMNIHRTPLTSYMTAELPSRLV